MFTLSHSNWDIMTTMSLQLLVCSLSVTIMPLTTNVIMNININISRMTNCDTWLWLVKKRSRAVRQTSVSNDVTPKPRPSMRHCQNYCAEIKSNVAWCLAMCNITRLACSKFFRLLRFFWKHTDKRVSNMLVVLLRCHFLQDRSVSVGVSVKKLVAGLSFGVYTCVLSATVRLQRRIV